MKKMNEYVNYIKAEKTPDELEQSFIKEFIRFRKENNLTQELLGFYSGVPRIKIARFEAKMHSPSVKSLIQMLGPLGYTITIEKIKNVDENKYVDSIEDDKKEDKSDWGEFEYLKKL